MFYSKSMLDYLLFNR